MSKIAFMTKARVMMVKLASAKEPDMVFSIAFWRRIGVQGRFTAAWAMVCDFKNWNPKHGAQQKLQKNNQITKSRRR